jgi:hypothetical protein
MKSTIGIDGVCMTAACRMSHRRFQSLVTGVFEFQHFKHRARCAAALSVSFEFHSDVTILNSPPLPTLETGETKKKSIDHDREARNSTKRKRATKELDASLRTNTDSLSLPAS